MFVFSNMAAVRHFGFVIPLSGPPTTLRWRAAHHCHWPRPNDPVACDRVLRFYDFTYLGSFQSVVQCWLSTNQFSLFAFCTSVLFFVKIDQGLRLRKCRQTNRLKTHAKTVSLSVHWYAISRRTWTDKGENIVSDGNNYVNYSYTWYVHSNTLIDSLLTLYRTEETQLSFVISHRPYDSLDKDRLTSAWEDIKERLETDSELSPAPLIAQTRERCQRHTDEVDSKAVAMSYNKQTRLIAKRMQDLIDLVTQRMFLIGGNFCPLWNDSAFSLPHVTQTWLVQFSVHTNNHWKQYTTAL